MNPTLTFAALPVELLSPSVLPHAAKQRTIIATDKRMLRTFSFVFPPVFDIIL